VTADARFYGVTYDDQHNPKAEEVEKAARSVVMLRIRPC
jgi:YD repeat-containing protein